MSNNFINDYLNGGGYQIDENINKNVVMNKKRKLRRMSRSKYIRGGFGDTNIQPLREDNTYTIDY